MHNKKAVVVLGRWQPPHLGHAEIIKRAKTEFVDKKFDAVFVIIVNGEKTSLDKTKNPLSVEDRITCMKNIEEFNGVKYVTGKNALDGLYKVRDEGYEPISVVGGKDSEEDKTTGYVGMLDKYFKTEDGEDIKHYNVTVDRKDNETKKNVSGTFVRLAVENDMKDVYDELVPIKSQKIKDKMYEKIKSCYKESK